MPDRAGLSNSSVAIYYASRMAKEVRRANKIHGHFNSLHEGYAVLKEEVDELWEEIKKKEPNNSNLHTEAIHVGAMAIKLLMFMEGCTGEDIPLCNNPEYVDLLNKYRVAKEGTDAE